MKKIAIILSGCGVYDGSEIHEAVLTLLAVEREGAQYHCFAPNINQHHVINHLTSEVSENETRNVLVESARIARGDVEDICELRPDDFDALIVPGGFGAAKNLSNFALTEGSITVEPSVLNACQQFAKAKKVVGYMCIAPVMMASIYGEGVKGTIGLDASIAAATENLGLAHVNCEVGEIVVDTENKVVSTPAYMLATSISEAASGIDKLVSAVIKMIEPA